MVYLVKNGGKPRAFYTEEEMKAAGFKKADGTTTEEIYNSNGCYVRLINGEFVFGKTDEEKAAEETQAKIDGYKAELAELDRKAMAGRFIRDISIAYAERNGMDSGKGYQDLVDIEAQAAVIRENLAQYLTEE
jgi:hypothetical protein